MEISWFKLSFMDIICDCRNTAADTENHYYRQVLTERSLVDHTCSCLLVLKDLRTFLISTESIPSLFMYLTNMQTYREYAKIINVQRSFLSCR